MEAVDFNETDQPSMLLSSCVTLDWGQPYADGDVDQFNTAPNAFKPHATSLLDPMTYVYYDDCW